MMTTVTVWKDSKKRCNPNVRYTSADGTRYTKVPHELYEDAVAADAPVDFSYDTHTIREIDDAPYFIYERKSAEEQARYDDTNALNKAKAHLLDTDYAFTVDKYAQLTEERKAELTASREAARQVIRDYDAKYNPPIVEVATDASASPVQE